MLITNFKTAYLGTVINTTDYDYKNLCCLYFKTILWQRTNQIKMSQLTYQEHIKMLITYDLKINLQESKKKI